MIKALWIIAICLILGAGYAMGADSSGYWRQKSPEQRQWLRTQRAPDGIKGLCCSEADGVEAFQEIRGDLYWVTFVVTVKEQRYQMGPMPVPPEAVITEGNRWQETVVWWNRMRWEDGKPVVDIRCFAPGYKF